MASCRAAGTRFAKMMLNGSETDVASLLPILWGGGEVNFAATIDPNLYLPCESIDFTVSA